ncbi:sulfatase-like hydrolase/transferase [Aquabacter sp. L1I39]|uniref:sulfatase-like hydrolase/transferase n=1 Tax=Aquabacter sp. L1I39 TaxID=2820278 RepID=UPI001FFC2B4E|nr:sulfatase-like hydrolase/transferase [Aquabacter sp. L1I39]
MPSRREIFTSGAALVAAGLLPKETQAGGLPSRSPSPIKAPDAPPGGYNILFILVDQEHFFDAWPFPVPGREWIKANGITFTNHQAASCVCSPARSTLYTGLHIPHTGVFDNANALWQPDMSTDVKTVGHRLAQLGYHAAYQGKWHLSINLDQVNEAIDAPFAKYRKIIESYGFDDFFGVGDINDRTLGGYNYDDTTTAFATRWLRTRGQELKAAGKPWYLAVNFVNPHDVMFINSDLPGQTVQGKQSSMPIARAPENDLYKATWDVPLPSTRTQAFNTPGRPKAQQIYQEVIDFLVGQWPDEDRRWRVLQNYYFNCIRDCDLQVFRMLEAIKANGMSDDTIIVFTADHGELGGHHQMRGKGNSTYRQQNHLPLMIVHPAYPGGLTCNAVTSQIDLAPTILALTGVAPDKLKQAGEGLPGHDFSSLLTTPGAAKPDTLRPGSLFCYNMLSYQDARWAAHFDVKSDTSVPLAQRLAAMEKQPPDFRLRCSIRSVFDGRYRFSRYFSPQGFNTPDTWEELTGKNDLEVYDLQDDPDEVNNLAMKGRAAGDLIMGLNAKLNGLIAAEVGVDDGSFLPFKDGKWVFPPASER